MYGDKKKKILEEYVERGNTNRKAISQMLGVSIGFVYKVIDRYDKKKYGEKKEEGENATGKIGEVSEQPNL